VMLLLERFVPAPVQRDSLIGTVFPATVSRFLIRHKKD
jgi:hypothetical protein